jgi:hypothetical protein
MDPKKKYWNKGKKFLVGDYEFNKKGERHLHLNNDKGQKIKSYRSWQAAKADGWKYGY